MKNTFLVLGCLLTSVVIAQIQPVGHLTIFSEDGDKFKLVLNGEMINETPQTNLRVEDLNQPYYNAKIIFEDASIIPVTKNNLMIADANGVMSDVTYKIKKDKNNATKAKLNYYSATPVQQGFIAPSNVHVVHYGQPTQASSPPPQSKPTEVTQTTTTTTTNQTEQVNVGTSVTMPGISVGIVMSDPTMGNVTSTTTTTTSSSTTQSSTPATKTEEVTETCKGKTPMTSSNFSSAMGTVKNQGFDETRLKIAKQVSSSNCLTVNQISQMAALMSYDESKLEYAKHAYDYCVDPGNYFNLSNVFSFSSSAESLTEYVESKN